MNRDEFLTILNQAAPALSSKDLVPILACFCFDGKTVMAYDDTVALRIPCVTEFAGGVRGDVLLGFLKATRAKEVAFDFEKANQLVVLAGRAELKQPLVPVADFVFEEPKTAGALQLPLVPELVDGLKKCLISMGRDPAHSWRLGITISFSRTKIQLFSSDNQIASRVELKCELPEEFENESVVLPPKFVELLISSAGKKAEGTLTLTAGWVKLEYSNGAVLFARAIDTVDVQAFNKVFACEAGASFVPIPRGFSRCIDRALVVCRSMNDGGTDARLKDGHMELETKTALGEVFDAIPVPEHPDTTIRMLPDLINRVIEAGTEIRFNERNVLVRNGSLLHFIRVLQK